MKCSSENEVRARRRVAGRPIDSHDVDDLVVAGLLLAPRAARGRPGRAVAGRIPPAKSFNDRHERRSVRSWPVGARMRWSRQVWMCGLRARGVPADAAPAVYAPTREAWLRLIAVLILLIILEALRLVSGMLA